jgi:Ca2+-binding RTX toxin-like protein
MATINGNAKANRLFGTAADDSIFGFGGNDFLDGKGGNDTLDGGSGDDRAYGGAGNDLFRLSTGADLLNGSAGTDTVAAHANLFDLVVDLQAGTATYEDNDAGSQSSRLSGIENVTGSDDPDSLFGNAARNVIRGADGDDILGGRGGDDLLEGGSGDDRFAYESGSDRIDGGDGSDVLDYSASPHAITLDGFRYGSDLQLIGSVRFGNPNAPTATDEIQGIERIVGTGHDDKIALDGGDEQVKWRIDGGAGNDFLIGYGDDRIDGGTGDDHILNHTGKDHVEGGAGRDRFEIYGPINDDTLVSVGDFTKGQDKLDLLIQFDDGSDHRGRGAFAFLDTNDDDRITGADDHSTFGKTLVDGAKVDALTLSVTEETRNFGDITLEIRLAHVSSLELADFYLA